MGFAGAVVAALGRFRVICFVGKGRDIGEGIGAGLSVGVGVDGAGKGVGLSTGPI